MDKNKKKTLTISSSIKKRIDTTSFSSSGKKSFSIDKKKPYKGNKPFKNQTPPLNTSNQHDVKKKILPENL